jgi:hypothetical protein
MGCFQEIGRPYCSVAINSRDATPPPTPFSQDFWEIEQSHYAEPVNPNRGEIFFFASSRCMTGFMTSDRSPPSADTHNVIVGGVCSVIATTSNLDVSPRGWSLRDKPLLNQWDVDPGLPTLAGTARDSPPWGRKVDWQSTLYPMGGQNSIHNPPLRPGARGLIDDARIL